MDTSEGNSCIVVSESEIYGLKSPHSSAVLDLNGDCISDLFVLSQKDPFSNGSVFFEAWIRTIGTDGAALFCLKYYEEVDYDVSQVAFADIGYFWLFIYYYSAFLFILSFFILFFWRF